MPSPSRTTSVTSPPHTDALTALAALPPAEVSVIGVYDNWDPRECALANASVWRTLVRGGDDGDGGGGGSGGRGHTPPRGLTAAVGSEATARIPRVLHQIWVGPADPPCVWLDTWRLDYVAAYPGWTYRLWDDARVADLPMANADLYAAEAAWQCKADLLRLEILWTHGGVYVDADMVSVVGATGGARGDLSPLLEAAERHVDASGNAFLIGYEPDTRDKPYPVLGNSFIAATPRHPLVALLIRYTRICYAAKRATHAVEWVTGPLTYTKALIHTDMPGVAIAPQAALYPAFHYVPDPGAVDVTAFPEALTFQFGYTCSGLGEWVRRNNLCRNVRSCAVHSRRTYALGGLRPLPVAALAVETAAGDKPRALPQVVHQFWFGHPAAAPRRWMDTWVVDFVADHPGWVVRVWDAAGVRAEFRDGLFAAHLYGAAAKAGDKDDPATVVRSGRLQLLALEVLYQCGGYVMPVSSMYMRGVKGTDGGVPIFPTPPASSVVDGVAAHSAGILAAPAGSAAVLAAIQAAAAAPPGAPLPSPLGTLPSFANVHLTGFSDDVACGVSFPTTTTYLGASAVVLFGQCPPRPAGTLLSWAYACQTPLGTATDGVPGLPVAAATAPGPVVLVTNPLTLAARPLLRAAIPGGVHDAAAGAGASGWAALALGVAYDDAARKPGVTTAPAPEGMPAGVTPVGVVVPSGAAAVAATAAAATANLVATAAAVGKGGGPWATVEASPLPSSADASVAALQRVGHLFRAFARGAEVPGGGGGGDGGAGGVACPWGTTPGHVLEAAGDWVRGTNDGRLAFEVRLDEQGRGAYRCWGDDGCVRGEVRWTEGGAGGGRVEFLRCDGVEVAGVALP
ncbi:hypothetical protein MMPV_001625 [Pyropia vietnamensis]